MTVKQYHVHILEGRTIKQYIDQSQQYSEDFLADIYNVWMWGTAEEIHATMAATISGAITVEELRAELDNGTNVIVVDHSIQEKTGQIIVYFTNEPEVIGQSHTAPDTLQ